MQKTVIETYGLTKRYKSLVALNHVDMKINRGDIYGLVGDNGAGKSTLFKILSGLSFQSEGSFRLLGAENQRDQERVRSRMGVMIEEAGFYPQLTVEKNLECYRIQRGIPGKKCIEETLEITGLMQYRTKRCNGLSMGMKRRLGLAIALLGEPELLLLDEPINGLDPKGIIEIRTLLKRLNEEKNVTVVLSSHILPELEQVATTYGFLENGCLKEQISAKELKEKCKHYIEIVVSDPQQYSVLLEKKFPQIQYQVLPENTIYIYDNGKNIESYSHLAAEEGIGIRRLENRQISLEQYYANQGKEKGEKKHDKLYEK